MQSIDMRASSMLSLPRATTRGQSLKSCMIKSKHNDNMHIVNQSRPCCAFFHNRVLAEFQFCDFLQTWKDNLFICSSVALLNIRYRWGVVENASYCRTAYSESQSFQTNRATYKRADSWHEKSPHGHAWCQFGWLPEEDASCATEDRPSRRATGQF